MEGLQKEGIILHACVKDEWDKAVLQGVFETSSLRSQGFIHCSEPNTILRVANSNWSGRRDLILLIINIDKVKAEIKFEPDIESGIFYPHIYGPLNIDAVIEVKDFLPNKNGLFSKDSLP